MTQVEGLRPYLEKKGFRVHDTGWKPAADGVDGCIVMTGPDPDGGRPLLIAVAVILVDELVPLGSGGNEWAAVNFPSGKHVAVGDGLVGWAAAHPQVPHDGYRVDLVAAVRGDKDGECGAYTYFCPEQQ